MPRVLRLRVKDGLFMLGAVTVAALVAGVLLYRNQELAVVTTQSIDHFFDYTLGQAVASHTHLRPALLAHTLSSFLLASTGTILWIFFRPSREILQRRGSRDNGKIRELLSTYSTSAEDIFKLWPADKQYFWAIDGKGFIAYKAVGSIVFALAEPIAADTSKQQLINAFVEWAKSAGLRVCFMPVEAKDLKPYTAAGLRVIQIGSKALVNGRQFLDTTSRTKWWRWKKNRAVKSGYNYAVSLPPHSQDFLVQLSEVSYAWLMQGNRRERGFGLGYFDEQYLQMCDIHYLLDKTGRVAAFTNQLPTFTATPSITVDLLRYAPEAADSMPYLLLETINSLRDYPYFDLGFVPFASADKPLLKALQIMSAGSFSAKGLEQFKNKFDPKWQPIYLCYDGDLGDLVFVAVNIEKLMKPARG